MVTAAAIALAAAWWWWTQQRPQDVSGQPAAVEQANPAPAPPAPVPAAAENANSPAPQPAAPSESELASLRSSIVAAVGARDWSKAGPLIDNLLAKSPADADALEWRKLLAEGRKAELFAKLNPNAAAVEARDLASANRAASAGDYTSAIAAYQHVLATDPGNARARDGLKRALDAKATESALYASGELAKADQLYQQGDYAGAAASYWRVLATDPNNARARSGLKQASDAKAAEDRVFGKH
jgi:hypothetical protein